jgi:hypothetical protein
MALDLDRYREAAQRFVSELDREYYLQGAGLKEELEIEQIYDRAAWLFDPGTVAALNEAHAAATGPEAARRLRYLLAFALDGCLGRATRFEAQEAAKLEATLEVEANGRAIPYRQVPVEQANEPDGEVRAELERARDELLAERLNPLHVVALERSHDLCRELGWSGYADAFASVRRIDFGRLAGQTRAFLEATDYVYAAFVDPVLERLGLLPLGRLGRADLPRFFRAPDLDRSFPEEGLVASLDATLAGLGVDLRAQRGVHLDTESRPTKSPRAFCSPIRVPDEIYLVIAPVGGRDDYGALFHEAGHTEHYANTEASLAFEYRHLGDNSVTESFAFLLEHLCEDPRWLSRLLGIDDPGEAITHARAARLVFLRRYAAKFAYELELHADDPDLDAMPARYAELLAGATRVRWPRSGWIADVDAGFYVACYLRAWALETHWRRALRERFGESWFASGKAGEWLRGLWANGQRLDGEELLAEELGDELDFAALADEVAAWARAPADG